jgi:hypothetical protein
MPRPWDDDDDDRNWGAGEDFDDDTIEAQDTDDDEPTYPCPGCGAQVYELADACPYCGEYLALDRVDHAGSRPTWVWIGAIAAIMAMLASVLFMLLGLL